MIISSDGIFMEHITIRTEERAIVAQYDGISGMSCKTFSLEDFSPHEFKCIYGCSFFFQKEKKYFIEVRPMGHVGRLPMVIVMEADGRLIEIKGY